MGGSDSWASSRQAASLVGVIFFMVWVCFPRCTIPWNNALCLFHCVLLPDSGLRHLTSGQLFHGVFCAFPDVQELWGHNWDGDECYEWCWCLALVLPERERGRGFDVAQSSLTLYPGTADDTPLEL